MDVLIVEDDRGNREMLSRRFVRVGHDVGVAADAVSALRIVRQSPPRVILLDLGLPDMSGLNVISIIRSAQATQHMPIVVVTADGMMEQPCRQAGCDAFFVKPVEFSRLLELVRAFIARAA